MRRLLLATANRGKAAEIRRLLGDEVEILSLADLGLPSPAETGTTMMENAILKATSAAAASGLPVLADDSGIEIAALGNRPGVHSARYAGEDATDEENRAKVLRELADAEARGVNDRRARMVCVMAIADGPSVTAVSGTWEGIIARAPRGTHGFGYDPIFELPDGRTAAELGPEEKNARSHRAQALRKALTHLRTILERTANPSSEPSEDARRR